MPDHPSWWDPRGRPALRTLLLVALVAALFRLPGIGYPGEEYFDEVYHAKTALEYLRGQPPTEWVHPPTAKLLIAVGVAAFGYEPWAWRLAPALAGTLLAPVFLLLACEVLPTRRGALLATGLLLLDGVYLVQSRVAMTNVFAVLFQLLAALLVLRAGATGRLSATRMSAAGLALGLAISTRWTSLWAWGFLGLVFVALRLRRAFEAKAVPPRAVARDLALTGLAFGVIPLAVYYISYVPWMLQSHTLADVLLLKKATLTQLVLQQKAIWDYHAHLSATHHYFSPWWTWPWLYRPTWYFWWSGDQTVRGILALGNPAIWWASVPAVLWALVTGWRERDPRRLFAGAGFCLLYLPWGLSPRTLNFSHYLFEALPYACLALGMLLDRAWDGPLAAGARGYVVLAGMLFLLFLPILTGVPVAQGAWAFRFPGGAGLWIWFPNWI
ncbi:MAG: phospholipid carrier-dependent glycosyltransferase [Acidobacteria bacterium]|nr:phospholipid carrier-dependent glycosyltransferase [Acidobacteriota bacterium]